MLELVWFDDGVFKISNNISLFKDETLIWLRKKNISQKSLRVKDQSQHWKLTPVVPNIPIFPLSFKGDYYNHKEQAKLTQLFSIYLFISYYF